MASACEVVDSKALNFQLGLSCGTQPTSDLASIKHVSRGTHEDEPSSQTILLSLRIDDRSSKLALLSIALNTIRSTIGPVR